MPKSMFRSVLDPGDPGTRLGCHSIFRATGPDSGRRRVNDLKRPAAEADVTLRIVMYQQAIISRRVIPPHG